MNDGVFLEGAPTRALILRKKRIENMWVCTCEGETGSMVNAKAKLELGGRFADSLQYRTTGFCYPNREKK